MDKGLITNLIAAGIVLAGLWVPGTTGELLLTAGLFALSGALTNSLAIHMLFERVPGLYGSGVIALHFDEFKSSIRELIMQQFFNQENLDRFFDARTLMHSGMENALPEMIEGLDFDRAFDSLTDAIMASSMGSMLGFVGGVKALDGLREPFAARMKAYLQGYVQSDEFRDLFAERLAAASHSEAVLARIEAVIDSRLDELSPQQVKQIVQQMMRRHLGWLVVWGGVVGALIGLSFSALSRFIV